MRRARDAENDASVAGGAEEMRQRKKYRPRRDSICGSVKLLCVLFFWFGSTVFVLLHNKTILSDNSLTPLQITFGQSTVGMFLDLVILVGCGIVARREAKGAYSAVRHALSSVCPSPKRRRELLPLCVAFVLTKLLTLYSIALIPASLTYTIKATSPIFTVTIAYFVLGKVFSVWTYLSLIPITVGVAMAAVSKIEFSGPGLIYAVTSVGMGVGYQMYMKSLMDSTGAAAIAAAEAAHAHSVDAMKADTVGAASSSGSLVAATQTSRGIPPTGDTILPLSSVKIMDTGTGAGVVHSEEHELSMELTAVASASSDPIVDTESVGQPQPASAASTGREFLTNFVNTTTLHVQIAIAGTLGTLLISGLDGLYDEYKNSGHPDVGGLALDVQAVAAGPPEEHDAGIDAGIDAVVSTEHTTGSLFIMLVVNGMYNYGASLSSYLLLSLTSNLTWQITNAMKRLVVIVASVLYFRTPLTVLNVCGVALAVTGVSLYEAVRKPAGRQSRRHINHSNSEVEMPAMPVRPRGIVDDSDVRGRHSSPLHTV
eukprot:INCI13239.1.p1 GENE.INCI13239.1~~INCI13239.1.p1  ORF type:complete len:541 (+),score=86.33 INCI13239.1:105-1727(+)